MIQHRHFVALAALAASCLFAQDISGDWQGTLKVGQHGLRLVLRIARSGRAEWAATLQSFDQTPDRGVGFPATSFSLDGSHIKFAISQVHAGYDGNLTEAGESIVGTWTQGSPLPLEFRRATAATAWLDPSRHSVQFIEVEKDVRLEGIDLIDLEKKLRQLEPGTAAANRKQLIGELLGAALPAFERDLKREQQDLPEDLAEQPPSAAVPPVTQAILRGMQKYTRIPVPALAIYALCRTPPLALSKMRSRSPPPMPVTRRWLEHRRERLKPASRQPVSFVCPMRITTSSCPTNKMFCGR